MQEKQIGAESCIYAFKITYSPGIDNQLSQEVCQ